MRGDDVHHKGFTLLECLIASLLMAMCGLMVVTVLLVEISSAQKLAETSSDALTAQQIHALFRRDFSSIGYLGCGRVGDVRLITAPDLQERLSSQNVLRGADDPARLNLPAHIRARIIEGNSVLRFVRVDPATADVLRDTTSHNIVTNTAQRFDVGQSLIISDCQQAESFTVVQARQQAGMQRITPYPWLKTTYHLGAEVGEFQTWLYYVGDTGRKSPTGKSITALYRVNFNHPRAPSEWVEGVQALQLRYGVVARGEWRELSASEISDWSQVRSIHWRFQLADQHWEEGAVALSAR